MASLGIFWHIFTLPSIKLQLEREQVGLGFPGALLKTFDFHLAQQFLWQGVGIYIGLNDEKLKFKSFGFLFSFTNLFQAFLILPINILFRLIKILFICRKFSRFSSSIATKSSSLRLDSRYLKSIAVNKDVNLVIVSNNATPNVVTKSSNSRGILTKKFLKTLFLKDSDPRFLTLTDKGLRYLGKWRTEQNKSTQFVLFIQYSLLAQRQDSVTGGGRQK